MISFSQLGLTNSLDLYKCAKAFADIVIPQVSHWNKQKEPWHVVLIVTVLDSKPGPGRHWCVAFLGKSLPSHDVSQPWSQVFHVPADGYQWTVPAT